MSAPATRGGGGGLLLSFSPPTRLSLSLSPHLCLSLSVEPAHWPPAVNSLIAAAALKHNRNSPNFAQPKSSIFLPRKKKCFRRGTASEVLNVGNARAYKKVHCARSNIQSRAAPCRRCCRRIPATSVTRINCMASTGGGGEEESECVFSAAAAAARTTSSPFQCRGAHAAAAEMVCEIQG